MALKRIPVRPPGLLKSEVKPVVLQLVLSPEQRAVVLQHTGNVVDKIALTAEELNVVVPGAAEMVQRIH